MRQDLDTIAAFMTGYEPSETITRRQELNRINKFFMSGELLGDLLPDRLTWFKRYAPFLTSSDYTLLVNFINRLCSCQPFLEREIERQQKRAGRVITFSEFLNQGDADGKPVRSYLSKALKQAERQQAIAANRQARG